MRRTLTIVHHIVNNFNVWMIMQLLAIKKIVKAAGGCFHRTPSSFQTLGNQKNLLLLKKSLFKIQHLIHVKSTFNFMTSVSTLFSFIYYKPVNKNCHETDAFCICSYHCNPIQC